MKRNRFLVLALVLVTVLACSLIFAACDDKAPSHKHDFSQTWMSDKDSHWHICSCGAEDGLQAHQWNGGEVVTPMTCDTDGSKRYTCTVCGKTKTEKVPASHTFGELISKDVTCNEAGIAPHYHCSVCGNDYDINNHLLASVEIPAGHIYDKYEHDNDEHWTVCTRCDATTNAVSHTYDDGDVLTKYTCTTPGLVRYSCECGYKYDEVVPAHHNLIHSAGVEPKCETKGALEYWKCTTCGTFYANEEATVLLENDGKIVTIEKDTILEELGHDFDMDHWTSDTIEHGHYCTRDGCLVRYYNAANPSDPANVSGHTWSGTIEDVMRDGTPEACTSCTVCGATMPISNFEVVLNTGSDAIFFAGYGAKTTLNISPKSTDYYMFTYSGETPIKLFGEIYDEVERDYVYIEHTLSATNMAAIVQIQERNISKLFVTSDSGAPFSGTIALSYPLTYEDPANLIVNANGASQKVYATGAGVRYLFTAASGGSYKLEDVSTDIVLLAKKNGAFKVVSTPYEFTMSEGETIEFYFTLKYKDIDKEHPVAYMVKLNKHEFTIKFDGSYHWHECSHCHTTYGKTAHTWNSGVVTTPATCEEQGVLTISCTYEGCPAYYTVDIPANGHSYVAEFTYDGNQHWHKCANCDGSSTKEDHDYTIERIKNPTCTGEGQDKYTCTICEFEKTVVVPANGHKWASEYTYTNGKNGVHYLECENCDAETEHEPHTWDSGVVTKQPTCTEKGVKTYTSVCGAKYTEEIPAKGHKFSAEWSFEDNNANGVHWHECEDCHAHEQDITHTWGTSEVTKQPTCTAMGVTKYTCECGAVRSATDVPANGHSTHLVPEVAATCTLDGNIAYYHCDVCGKNYADQNGTTPAGEIVVPATDHHFDNVWHYDTNVAPGKTHYHKCVDCDAIENEAVHGFKITVTLEPTCTDEGVRTYTCTTCGGAYTEPIEANGHSWSAGYIFTDNSAGGKHWHECLVCHIHKEEEDIPHTFYDTVSTSATCTTDGVRTHICECGASYTTVISATGHTMTYYKANAATCTATGNVEYWHCSVCDKNYDGATGGNVIANVVTAMLEHDYDTVWHYDANNISTATTHYHKCKNCDAKSDEGNHSFSSRVTTAATCTTDGVRTYTCTTCSASYTEPVAALNHSWSTDWTFDNDEHWHKCVREGCSAVNGTASHTYNKQVKTAAYLKDEATAHDDAVYYYSCECGASSENGDGSTFVDVGSHTHTHEYATEYSHNATHHWFDCPGCDIDKDYAAHTFGEWTVTKAPTCEEKGTKAHECSVCHEVYTQDIDATGHDYDDTVWVYGTENVKNGTHYHKCKNCDARDDEANHSFTSAVTTPATCTVDGVRTYTCTTCSATYTEKIDATGHTYATNWTYTDSSANGKHWHECTVCHAHKEAEDIPHTFESEVTTSATCTVDGLMTYTCECGATYTAAIPATGHTMTHHPANAATCTAEGNVEYWHCSVCDKNYDGATGGNVIANVVTAKIAHDYDTVWHYDASNVSTSTTHYHKCKNCDARDNEANHSFTSAVTTAATCTTAGVRTYTCTTCSATYTETIGALNHNWSSAWYFVDGENGEHYHKCLREGCSATTANAAHTWDDGTVTKEPTCTETGLKHYECSICDATYNETLSALGHTLTLRTAKAPTCTEQGNIAYYYCSTCKKYFDDANATNELSVADVTIDAAGHTFASEWRTDGANHWHECTVCHDISDEGEHTWNAGVVTKEPGCSTSGTKTYTCSICSKVRNDAIPATGHDFEETWSTDGTYHWHICLNGCGEKDAYGNHNWGSGEVVTPATCTTAGLRVYTCSTCSRTKDEVITATGHALTHHPYSAPTCTVAGNSEYWSCDNCGTLFNDSGANSELSAVPVLPAKHTLKYNEAKLATCTEAGNVAYYSCSVCNKNFADDKGQNELTTIVDPAKGHTLVHHEAVAATCTATGTIEYWQCSTCNTMFGNAAGTSTITNYVTQALGHTYAKHTDALCNRCGEGARPINHVMVWNYDETGHWTYCNLGEGCTERTAVVDHEYEDDSTVICRICGYERTIPHDYVWYTNPSYHWQICSLHSEYVDATPHNFVGGVCTECSMAQMTFQTFYVDSTQDISGSVGQVMYFRVSTTLTEVKLTFTGCTVTYAMAIKDMVNYYDKGGYKYDMIDLESGEDFVLSGNGTYDYYIVTLTGTSGTMFMTHGTVPGMAPNKPKEMTLGVHYTLVLSDDGGLLCNYYSFTPSETASYTFYSDKEMTSIGAAYSGFDIYTTADYSGDPLHEERNSVYASKNLTAGTTYYIKCYGVEQTNRSILTVDKTDNLDFSGANYETSKTITVRASQNTVSTATMAEYQMMNPIKENLYQYANFYTFTTPCLGTLSVSGDVVYKFASLKEEKGEIVDAKKMVFNAGETVKIVVYTTAKYSTFTLTYTQLTEMPYHFRLVDQMENPLVGYTVVLNGDTTTQTITGDDGLFEFTTLGKPSYTFTVRRGTNLIAVIDTAFFADDGSNALGQLRTIHCLLSINVKFHVYLDGAPYTGNEFSLYTDSLSQTDTMEIFVEKSTYVTNLTNGVYETSFVPENEEYNYSARCANEMNYYFFTTTINNYYKGSDSKVFNSLEEQVFMGGDVYLYVSTKVMPVSGGTTIPYDTATPISFSTYHVEGGDYTSYKMKTVPGAVYQVIGIPTDESFYIKTSSGEMADRLPNMQFTAASTQTTLFFFTDWEKPAIGTARIVRVDGTSQSIELASFMADEIPTQQYTGSAIEPALSIKRNGVLLTRGTDYLANFSNNVNIGTASVSISGINDYSGNFTLTFKIKESYGNYEVIRVDEYPTIQMVGEQGYTAAVKGDPNGIYKIGFLLYMEVYDVNGDMIEYNDSEGGWVVTLDSAGYAVLKFKNSYNNTETKTLTFTKIGTYVNTTPITSDMVSGLGASATYTGSAITFPIVVSDGGTTLTAGVDYDISYSGNLNAGTATVTITGKNDYSGNLELHFTINPVTLTSAMVTGIPSSAVYSGSAIKPAVTVKNGAQSLTANTDYTVTYGANLNAGTGTVTVTGKGNYQGTVTSNFTIEQYTILAGMVTGVPTSVAFTGSAHQPVPTVKFNGNAMTAGTDYTVTYGTNLNAGSASVTVTGTGNFKGEITKTFTITTVEITASMVGAIGTQEWTGSEIRPSVTVTLGSYTLTSADFDATYSNNTNVGTASIKIDGKGNFTGSVTVNFTISQPTHIEEEMVGELASVVYTGSELTPVIVVSIGSDVLVAGVDYEVTYSGDRVNVGTATAIITGKGIYSGSVERTFSITPAPLANNMISPVARVRYDGAPLTPAVTVTFSGRTLTKGTDYDVTYVSNNAVGTATIKVTGKGNFGGTATRTFEIYGAITITSSMISGYQQSVTYTGSKFEPTVTVNDGTNNLTIGIDYTVSYGTNLGAGTGTITVTGREDYTGSVTVEFEIVAATITEDMVGVMAAQQWTGEALEPDVIVTFSGRTLTKGTDYDIAYDDNTDAGTATATITGKGNFKGSVERTFEICKKAIISSATVTIVSQIYSGDNLTPQVSVVLDGEGLYEDRDFEVDYGTYINAGTYQVTVIGKGNYEGSATGDFVVTKANLASAVISGYNSSYEVIGEPIEPAITVKYNGKIIAVGTQYTIGYGENTNPGIGTITITAKPNGNFQGSQTVEFTIAAPNVEMLTLGMNENIELDTNKEYMFSGVAGEQYNIHAGYTTSPNSPRQYDPHLSVSMTGGGATLSGRVLTFTSDATISLRFASPGGGEDKKNITIVKRTSVENAEVLGVDSVYAFTGYQITPMVTVKVNGRTLDTGLDDYMVEYRSSSEGINNITSRGVVVVKGTEDYFGTCKVYFTIKLSMDEYADVEGIDLLYPTPAPGSKVRPEFTVYYDGTLLVLNQDYTVAYGDNNVEGSETGYVTITATESCVLTGSKTVRFSIGNEDDATFSTDERGTYTGVETFWNADITLIISANSVHYTDSWCNDYDMTYDKCTNGEHSAYYSTEDGKKYIYFSFNADGTITIKSEFVFNRTTTLSKSGSGSEGGGEGGGEGGDEGSGVTFTAEQAGKYKASITVGDDSYVLTITLTENGEVSYKCPDYGFNYDSLTFVSADNGLYIYKNGWNEQFKFEFDGSNLHVVLDEIFYNKTYTATKQ